MSPKYDKTTILLDDKNWSTWRTFIKGRLMGKGLIHTLLRHSSSMTTVERTMNRDEFASRAIPEVDAITYAKDNQKALGIIIESINVNQYQHVDGLTDALAAYLALKAHHEPQTHVDKIGLLAEYHAIRWEPKREILPVFIDRFYNLVRKLRDTGCAENEYMTVAKLLAIMPWCLHYKRLLLLDRSWKPYKAAVANGALQAPGNEAGVTRALGALDSGRDRGGRGRGRGPPKAGRGASRSQKREGTCHHCGKVGHWKAECHARQRGDPPTAMPSRAPGNESVGAAPNHTVYLFAGMEAPGLSLSAAKATEKIIIDSGASSYMTGAKDHLYDVAACDRTIIVANGEVANATTMGKLDIDMQNGAKMTLTEVLIIDGMPMTLVSVPALCRRNAACTVSFGQGKCSIAVGSTAIATGTLEMPANVYVLNGTMSMPTSATSATSTTSPISNSDKSTLWHERVGHVPLSTLKHCSTLQLGLPTDLAGTLNTPCPACVVSKMHKATAPKSSTRTYKTGECWVSDTKGPMRTETVGGCKYYTIYIDVASGYKIARFVKSTDAATQDENFKEVLAWSERQTGRMVKQLRTDGGSEYASNDFRDWLKGQGIHHERSQPDNQWQNGIAERSHRTVMEMAMSMMARSGLARRWWGEAVNTAIFIQNRIVHNTKDSMTPIEEMTGHKPNLANLKVFGCVAYNMIKDPSKREKLAPKAHKCVFIGYAEDIKAYRLYDLEDEKVTTGVHVTFHENEFLHPPIPIDSYLMRDNDSDDDSDTDDEGERFDNTPKQPGTPLPATEEANEWRLQTKLHKIALRLQKAPIPDDMKRELWETQLHLHKDIFHLQSSLQDIDAGERPSIPSGRAPSAPPPLTPAPAPAATRPTRDRRAPVRFDDEDFDHRTRDQASTMTYEGVEYSCSALPSIEDDVPQSHAEAMSCREKLQWREAERRELEKLQEQGTWTLAALPKGRKAIGNKWVYSKKKDANGAVVAFKARLVIKGFSQVEGVDHPCGHGLDLRRGLVAVQCDANNAFVQANLPPEIQIYMKQVEGYKDGSNKACLLQKALYGLKQASLAWYLHCKGIMISLGFMASQHDPCLFLRSVDGQLEAVCTYVDDFIITAATTVRTEAIMVELEGKMDVKRQRELHYFIGIKIERDLAKKTLTMSQGAFAERVLKRFKFHESHGQATPEAEDTDGTWDDPEQPTTDESEFRAIVGSLMYLTTCTRPDISHAVQRLTRHMHDPRLPHLVGAKRILRYLRATTNMGITYRGDNMTLVGIGDASWATKPDRKSTTGFICLVCGGAVSWKYVKQRIVALSTCESEYVAAAEATKDGIWLRGILDDIGETQVTTTLFCDNKAAIVTAQNDSTSDRSKHIAVRHHFIRNVISGSTLKLAHVGTADMFADVLTKVSTRRAIEKFRNDVVFNGENSISANHIKRDMKKMKPLVNTDQEQAATFDKKK
ncbi:hypothetical protein AaE_013080 [Aphanomyces astaci]|uniref:Integrase catalytic domain-containing protein n=2 Tax=Aphanomyces astaci TaxID=112090 RepID=A0A6A4ZC53_APHAT|nr:hypothetical protein AaE_013080 [Aphanomyces astaci]